MVQPDFLTSRTCPSAYPRQIILRSARAMVSSINHSVFLKMRRSAAQRAQVDLLAMRFNLLCHSSQVIPISCRTKIGDSLPTRSSCFYWSRLVGHISSRIIKRMARSSRMFPTTSGIEVTIHNRLYPPEVCSIRRSPSG